VDGVRAVPLARIATWRGGGVSLQVHAEALVPNAPGQVRLRKLARGRGG